MSFLELVDLGLVLLVFVAPFVLFFVAWGIGSWIEARHFTSIREREALFAGLPVASTRSPDSDRCVVETRLVQGNVVVSNDHFKRVLAGLRGIFGGRIRAYESLADRARREAILRMKADWPEADIILNLRLETSCVAQTSSQKNVGAFEVVAYGTGVRYG